MVHDSEQQLNFDNFQISNHVTPNKINKHSSNKKTCCGHFLFFAEDIALLPEPAKNLV